MPTNAEVLLDTSAALAWVDRDHQSHGSVDARLAGHRLGLAGHAAFETYSVLTRRQPPKRLAAPTARPLIEDGLVAAAANNAGLLLVSCDVRAAATYRALGVKFELIPNRS